MRICWHPNKPHRDTNDSSDGVALVNPTVAFTALLPFDKVRGL